ncbi:cytochrome P450 3A12-like [Gastrophryne carolinensis]
MHFLPEFFTETWILIILLLALLVIYSIWPYRLFKKYGIPGPTPLPFIGTFYGYRIGWFEFDFECYKKYGRVWGFYDGRTPALAVMDPAIIKAILVRDCFTVFTNRRNFGLNGLLNHAISVAEDENWKRIRAVMSPTFTSGKIKQMSPIVKEYGDLLLRNIQKKIDNKEPINMRYVFGSYSMDVVLSTSFSMNVDSMNDPKNPLVTHIEKLFEFSFFSPLFLLTVLFPFLIPVLNKMNFCFFPWSVLNFFQDLLKNIKQERQKGMFLDRVDFLQLMLKSQTKDKSSSEALSDPEIVAQGLIFIMAGYNTTCTTLTFLAYLLATHPDVQTKVVEEIDNNLPNKVPPTYNDLMKMEYLEMVIYETLRLYPVVGRVERVCKQTTEINGVTIPKGVVTVIPAFVLHRDPSLWPDPEEFRPERFSKENRETQKPYTYLPFGAGPRNCIGLNFALMNMKSVFTTLLQNFSLHTCKDTPIPLKIDTNGFMKTTEPVILNLVPRGPKTNGHVPVPRLAAGGSEVLISTCNEKCEFCFEPCDHRQMIGDFGAVPERLVTKPVWIPDCTAKLQHGGPQDCYDDVVGKYFPQWLVNEPYTKSIVRFLISNHFHNSGPLKSTQNCHCLQS